MRRCPLCGLSVNSETGSPPGPGADDRLWRREKDPLKPQAKKRIWEVISLSLLALIVATLLIDFILNRRITWSEYPVSVSLTVFTYLSLFAFSKWNLFVQMVGGFVVASVLMIGMDALTQGLQWALTLGMPLLIFLGLLVGVLAVIVRKTKNKGINIIAYGLIAAMMLSIWTECVLALYRTDALQLKWSPIVALSALPVVLVLFYMHFRLKKGRDLERMFHV